MATSVTTVLTNFKDAADGVSKLIFSQDNPYCVMFVGLPGTGKTTFRNLLLDYLSPLFPSVISSDDYILKKAQDNDLTYTEAFHEYGDAAVKSATFFAQQYVANGVSFIIDQTNPTRKSRLKKLNMLTPDYTKIGVFLNAPGYIVKRRLEIRGARGAGVNVYDKMDGFFQEPTDEFDYLFVVEQ